MALSSVGDGEQRPKHVCFPFRCPPIVLQTSLHHKWCPPVGSRSRSFLNWGPPISRGQQKLRCRNGTNVKKQKVRRTTPKFHKKQKTNDVILLHEVQVSQMYTIRTTIRLQNESCATDKIQLQHFLVDQVRRLGKGVRGKVNPAQKGRKVCNTKLILNHLGSEG